MTTETPEAPPLANPTPTQPPAELEEVVQVDTPIEGEEQGEDTELQGEESTPPEGWEDSSWAKAHRQSGYEEAQAHKDKEWNRKLREANAQAGQTADQRVNEAMASQVITSVLGTVNELSAKVGRLGRDGSVDPQDILDGVGQLMRENQSWASIGSQALQRYHQEVGRSEGLGDAFKFIYSGLSKELQEELADYVADEINLEVMEKKITREQGFEKALKKRSELDYKRAEGELNKLVSEREKAEHRAEKRNGQKPPVNPGGRGGGGKIDNSDAVRTKRLAYGRDDQGNAPTDEDRAWLRARN